MSAAISLPIGLLSLTSCSPPPPVVSGDTYCERAKYIHATQAEKDVIVKDEPLWRPLVEQIASHNDTYTLNCTIPDLIKETK